jgi:hypothetical protein
MRRYTATAAHSRMALRMRMETAFMAYRNRLAMR